MWRWAMVVALLVAMPAWADEAWGKLLPTAVAPALAAAGLVRINHGSLPERLRPKPSR